MNILFISDNFKKGGLETHVETFFKKLKQHNNIGLLFASNFSDTPYFKSIDLYTEKLFNIEVSDYSPIATLKLSKQLTKIVEYNPVDLIHAHPFISILSSFLSAVEKNIPFAFTLHGKASLFAPDEVSNLFLKTIVFKNGLGFSVNPSFIPDGNIHYLPNPIDEEFWKNYSESNSGEYVLIVSRLDTDKSQSVALALGKLKSLNIPIIVAGDGQEKDKLEKEHPFAKFVGYKTGKELRDLMLKAAFICGMGRVVLEASFLRKPVILLNYEGDLIILDDEIFKRAKNFNFNGSNLTEESNILDKIKSAVKKNALPVISWDLLKDFSATAVIEKYINTVERYINTFKGYDQYTKSACSFYRSYLEKLDYSKEIEGEKDKLSGELKILNSKISDLESKNLLLQSRIELLETKLNDTKNKYNLLKEERDKILSEKELLYNRLDDIYRSRLWKVVRVYQKFKRKVLKKEDKKQTSLDFEKQALEILKGQAFKGIVVYPPTVDWNIPLFQRPQHLALNFSKFGYLYFHCTPNAGYDSVSGLHKIKDKVYLTDKFNSLIDILSKLEENKYIFIPSTNLNVTSEDMKNYKNKGFTVIYDYIDEIHESITYGNTDFIKERHGKLSKDNVDLILCVSKKLYGEMKERFKNASIEVLLVENGVDYDHFHVKKVGEQIPEKIKGIVNEGKPKIGYYGALAKWIDYDLINYVAKNRQDLNFVFIGVDYDGSIKNLDNSLDNVHYIGPISYWDLPKYAVWFDVTTIPFKNGDVAKSTSPLKLYEYMSLNKPTVCTKDLIECKRYKSTLIAENKDDFIAKIDEALKLKDDKEFLKLVDREAKENTWEIRVRTIIDALNKISHDR